MKQIANSARCNLVAALLFILPSLAAAQVTVYASSHTVLPDENFTVSIKTTNFDSIAGCQFSVSWDTTLFRLQEAGNLNENLSTIVENFNYSEADSGYLGFLWFEPAVQPISLEDDATLFTMDFEVLEDNTTLDSIRFTDFPVVVEFANANEQTLDVSFIPGAVQIDGINSIRRRNAAAWLTITSGPNPFQKVTSVTLDFKQGTEAEVVIYDAQGQQISRVSNYYAPGQHLFEVDAENLGGAGAYVLRVTADEFELSHKLLLAR